MLGKYIQYEIKSTGRYMAVIYGILAAATALITVLHTVLRYFQIQLTEAVFGGISIALYAITIIVLIVTAFIYLCYRFYHTMYSPQGYLTHTLPLESTQILNIKLLSSIGYLLITTFICCLSISITASVITGEGINLILYVVNETFTEAAIQIGVTKPAAAACVIILVFLSVIYPVFLYSAGCSIGQLFSRSKGACGIAAMIALYYFTQIVSVLFLIFVFFVSYKFTGGYSIKWLFSGAFIILLFWTAVYYMVSRMIIQKHLNLE